MTSIISTPRIHTRENYYSTRNRYSYTSTVLSKFCWHKIRGQTGFYATSSYENTLRYSTVAIEHPDRHDSNPSRGHPGTLPEMSFLIEFSQKTTFFDIRALRGCPGHLHDTFLTDCLFCATSSIQSHLRKGTICDAETATTMFEPYKRQRKEIKLCDVIEREPPFSTAV